jgi:hypothetical protein
MPVQFLSGYKRSLYIDNTVRLKAEPARIFEDFRNQRWVMFIHNLRDCIYDEAEAVIEHGFEDPAVVRLQMERYRSLGYPARNGLNLGTFILRSHDDLMVSQLGAEWHSQVVRYSKRDQLSFNFCVWDQQFAFHSVRENILDNDYLSWPHFNGPRLPRDFDNDLYLRLHPDVAAAKINPRLHFLVCGMAEGRAYK